MAAFPLLFIAAMFLEEQVIGTRVSIRWCWFLSMGMAPRRHRTLITPTACRDRSDHSRTGPMAWCRRLDRRLPGRRFILGSLPPLEGTSPSRVDVVGGGSIQSGSSTQPEHGDRRFNRSRFDRERTMEALALRLSSEFDLTELGSDRNKLRDHDAAGDSFGLGPRWAWEWDLLVVVGANPVRPGPTWTKAPCKP